MSVPFYGNRKEGTKNARYPGLSVSSDAYLAPFRRLPPYMIVVGDRRRVESIAAILDESTLLHEEMRASGKNIGRVNMAVGTWKGTPIVVMEHQMGCSATEINVREALSREQMDTCFTHGSVTVHAPAKYVIRVGSAAGVNTPDVASISGFDLVVASHQVGVSGSDIQALTGQLNLFDGATLDSAKRKLEALGYRFEQGWPCIDLDPALTSLLAANARLHAAASSAAGLSVHIHGNVSKDSLYAEAHEEHFVRLRADMGVGSSEMEMSALCRLAAEQTRDRHDPVVVGLVVTVLGLIPGSSFLSDKVRRKGTPLAQHPAG